MADDRYELIRRLGSGAMGDVWLAHDRKLGREVAVKHVSTGSAFEDAQVRFEEEAKSLVRLSHPNIVRMLDYSVDDAGPSIVFEYIEGDTLEEHLEKVGRLSLLRAVDWAIALCRAMAQAHDQGILHRDLKTANLMIDDRGEIKVTDFGLALRHERQARLTETGVIMGTPEYISPEQIRGVPCVPASDVYSAGIVIFEMLTGTVPFAGGDVRGLILAHATVPAPDPRTRRSTLPESLAVAVLRALEKDPKERFQSFGDFAEALEACRAQVAALPPEAPEAADRSRSHRTSRVERPVSGAMDRRATHVAADESVALSAVSSIGFASSATALPDAQAKTGKGRHLALLVLLFVAGGLAWFALGRHPGLQVKEVRVVAGADAVTVTWTEGHPARYAFAIRRPGADPLRKGVESEAQRAHRVVLRGLQPETGYVLTLRRDDRDLDIPFTTDGVGLEEGVRACAMGGRLYIDFRANVKTDLVVAATGGDGKWTRKSFDPALGYVILRLPAPRRRGALHYEWTVRWRDRVLVRGRTRSTIEPLRRLATAAEKRSKAKISGRVDPIWCGGGMATADRKAVIALQAFHRRVSGEGVTHAMDLSWIFRCRATVTVDPNATQVGGLFRLDDERFLAIYNDRAKGLRAWCFDVAARKAAWRKRVGSATLVCAPAWVEDGKDAWYRPLGPREWTASAEGWTQVVPASIRLVDGAILYQRILERSADWHRHVVTGYVAFDPAKKRFMWKRTCSREDLVARPWFNPKTGAWGRLEKKHVWTRSQWRSKSTALIVGNTLFDLHSPGQVVDEKSRIWTLLAVPLGKGDESVSARCCFHFSSKLTVHGLLPGPRGRSVTVVGQGRLYRWTIGGRGRPEILPIPGFLDDGAYVAGPVARLGSRTLAFQGKESMAVFMSMYRAGTIDLLSLRRLAGKGVARVVFGRPVLEATDDRLPVVRDLRTQGDGVVGAFGHQIFAVSLKSRRAGAFQPDQIKRIRGFGVGPGPGHWIAFVDSHGDCWTLPRALLLAAGRSLPTGRRTTIDLPAGFVGSSRH